MGNYSDDQQSKRNAKNGPDNRPARAVMAPTPWAQMAAPGSPEGTNTIWVYYFGEGRFIA
jgi:hypothetical protein